MNHTRKLAHLHVYQSDDFETECSFVCLISVF